MVVRGDFGRSDDGHGSLPFAEADAEESWFTESQLGVQAW